jgi:hypothetical protein
MSLELTPTQKTLPHRQIACLSMEFIDAAFGYQREILQMRHQEERAVFENPGRVATENETLQLKKKENTLRLEALKIHLEMAQKELNDKKQKILELKDLVSNVVNRVIHNRPVPREILLKCKEELFKKSQQAQSETCGS